MVQRFKEYKLNENTTRKTKNILGVSFVVNAYIMDGRFYINYLPSSSNDLDKLYKLDKLEVINSIEEDISSKLDLDISYDSSHEGSGFWFKIYGLEESIIKKL